MSQSELKRFTPSLEIPTFEYLESPITFEFSHITEFVLLSFESIFTYFKKSVFILSKDVLTFHASCFIQVYEYVQNLSISKFNFNDSILGPVILFIKS